MTKDYNYTWQKLHAALTTLMEHPGRIQERLHTALECAQTVFSDIDRDFPPDARPMARELIARMTRVEDEEAGTFAASANALSDDEAKEVVHWLHDLYFRIHAASGANDWMGEELRHLHRSPSTP